MLCRIKHALIIALLVFSMLLSGCGLGNRWESDFRDAVEMELPDVMPPLQMAPVIIPVIPMPTAPGLLVVSSDKATIDYSNSHDGYVKTMFAENDGKQVRVLVLYPDGTEHTYRLPPGEGFIALPLTGGDGEYSVEIWEQIEGMEYVLSIREMIQVALGDEFAPFIRPSRMVDYSQDSLVVRTAAEQTAGIQDPLEKINALYYFVIENIVYDDFLSETVESGYIPDVDAVLISGSGICFDYATVMTAMLRSQGIPTRLVIGFKDDEEHAWISVYSEESGMINELFHFDGGSWSFIDPTAAASGNEKDDIRDFIGDWTTYQALFYY